MRAYSISLKQWVKTLSKISTKNKVFAPIKQYDYIDYALLTDENISDIAYNQAKPVTPLKTFFFPIKDNVTINADDNPKVVFGVPSCDLHGLDLLDKIFLDEQFLDQYYQSKRENTIIIGSDCYATTESCHCTSYKVDPFPEKNCDISFSLLNHKVTLQVFTEKGEKLLNDFTSELHQVETLPKEITQKRESIIELLNEQNKDVPNIEKTRENILNPGTVIWKKYAENCVSCGACAVICPTCHCFLLIDKENFEKVKNWDSCQYPAFERVAGDEDPLRKIYDRLKNRYLCKFVHKPDMFDAIACTGCGRCIDACIGKINKNDLIIEAGK